MPPPALRPCLLFLLLWNVVRAQLTLPSSPFQPQNASVGAIKSQSKVPNTQWSQLLGNLLYYYDAQRSGKLPANFRVTWRNDSCLDDGSDHNVDLSGGYYDAGDYPKFTFPLSWTLTSICWGALSSGPGFDMANQTAELDSMLRWGLDWLIKAHPQNSTLWVAVMSNDDYWGGDQGIPKPRPSYQVNDTSPGTDVAAGTSAAFASCSALYSGQTLNSSPSASLQNTSYAQTLLTHAEQLYSFAVNASAGQRVYQKSVPAVADAYGSGGFNDELALAALFLAQAANSTTYRTLAESTFKKITNEDPPLNWDDKTGAVYVLGAQLTKLRSDLGGDLNTWQNQAERYLDKVVNGHISGFITKGGLLFYNGVSDPSSLNPALNAAMLLKLYAPIATSSQKQSSYQTFAIKQRDYALGNNPMSCPYVVGVNPNSPQNPHSALASGGSDPGTIDTDPVQEAHVLYGAVVGGPTNRDAFWDIRSDWPETEPAIDTAAPLLTLAAMAVMSEPNDPFYTSLQAGEYQKRRPKGGPCDDASKAGCLQLKLSKGSTIAMAVSISVAGLVIISLLSYILFARRGK